MQHVCVYAASSNRLHEDYKHAARTLGALIGRRGLTLVYGGGNIGLMGEMARAVHAEGGRVIGVIPEKLRDLELAYDAADELIITHDMRERKAVMEQKADAFIAMPGGLGTLEEIIEVLVLKQLMWHDRPLVFLNTRGIYDGLMRYLSQLYDEGFVVDHHQALYHVAQAPDEVFDYLDSYQPPDYQLTIPR